MKPLSPKLIPEMSYRIELRGIGRKGQESHVFRNHQVLISMLPGPVHHHDQSVLRVPGRHFLQKDLHAGSVDVGGIRLSNAPSGVDDSSTCERPSSSAQDGSGEPE